MLNIKYTTRFKKDTKVMKKRGKDLNILYFVIEKLVNEETLPGKYRDHSLIGNYNYSRECHIEPDWLLIYTPTIDTIILERTGSHSDLFK
jgi:mRNA interferase YafQ